MALVTAYGREYDYQMLCYPDSTGRRTTVCMPWEQYIEACAAIGEREARRIVRETMRAHVGRGRSAAVRDALRRACAVK